MSPCQRCTRTSQDPLCVECFRGPDGIAHDIAILDWLDQMLTVTRTRQDRLAPGRRGTDIPLGYSPGAARAQDALRTMVTTWARDLDYWRADRATTLGQCVAILLDEHRVRRHPAAGELVHDVERIRDWALERINLEEELPTFGACGTELEDGTRCPGYLYGERAAAWVRCRLCRTQHQTSDRAEWMRRRLAELYFRAATLARLLPLLMERPVSADHIRAWHRAGKPIGIREDDAGYPTYHCGDVLSVAAATPQRPRRAVCAAAG